MNTDIYPSRTGDVANVILRKDPVIYCNEETKGPIDKQLVQKYKEQGFLILENLLSPEEVLVYQEELENLKRTEEKKQSDYIITERGSGKVRSVFKVHEISPVFKKLAADERLAGLARYLLNDEVYIHQSRVNYKPGFKGKEFYWHSDFETWHTEDGMPRMRALSISVTLTDNYTYNGSLMLVPGSHNVYASCAGETPENNYKSSLKKQEYGVPDNDSLSNMVEKGGITTATGKAGTVVVFDCNTMHGSNGNISPFPRSNVFFVYNALSNKVVEPFCKQAPRPEYICSRENIKPVE